MTQGGERSTDAPVTVTGGPITVTRRVERGPSGLTATYVLSTTEGVVGTRIRDELPGDADAGDVEFHPEYGPHVHDVDGADASFEAVVRPEAPTEVALRVAPADAGFDAPPTVDAVRSVAPARLDDDRSLFDQPSTEESGGILSGVRSLLGSDSPAERRPPNETVPTDADAMAVDLPSMAAVDAAVADGADERAGRAMADGSDGPDGSVTPETEPEAADADDPAASDERDEGIVIPDIEPDDTEADDGDAEADDGDAEADDGTPLAANGPDADPEPSEPSDDRPDGTAPADADSAPPMDAPPEGADAVDGASAPADAAGESDAVETDETPPRDPLDARSEDAARADASTDGDADAVTRDAGDVSADEAAGDGVEADGNATAFEADGDADDAASAGASVDGDADDGDDAPVDSDGADVAPADADDEGGDDVDADDAASEGVAAALIAELEAGDVEASERERLREALGVDADGDDTGSDATRSVDVRLDHMQARVEEFGAYANALEGLIDDYGTADGFAARTEESLAEVDDRLDAVREDVAALNERQDDLASSSDLDAVREEVRGVDEDVTTLREELADSEAERDRKVSRMQDDLDSLATDVRERQDDLRADLVDVREEVRALRADVEEMSEMRETLAAAFGGDDQP